MQQHFPEVKLSREELTVEVIRRRRAGITYDAIRAELGVPQATAHTWVTNALREATGRRVAESEMLRTQHIDRLEALLAAVWPLAEEGSVQHIAEARRLVLAIMHVAGPHDPIQMSWGLADVQRAIDAVDRAIAERAHGSPAAARIIEGQAAADQTDLAD
jgi:hypothetical protein